MSITIKIIGSGISGLLTAYHLQKLTKDSKDIHIEIYDQHDKKTENASTYSLAWINAVYPSKDMKNDSYDIFRLKSIDAWKNLNEQFKKDGIKHTFASDQQCIKINDKKINALSVFFDKKHESDFVELNARLKKYSDSYHTESIPQTTTAAIFPFIGQLHKTLQIQNASEEQLVNPKLLRAQLIDFLEQKGIHFHWNSVVTSETIDSEPNTQWVLAAGDGCLPLVKNTKLAQLKFYEKSLADIIQCTLTAPLDLKGKVFYFASTDNTPSFHLRNDELNPNRLTIIVASQGGKSKNLNKDAQAIFNLLKIKIKDYICIDDVVRPITPDGRPLVEMQLGKNKNIHMVYGHSLYSNGAKLFIEFSKNIAHFINENQLTKSEKPSFVHVQISSELEQFDATDRFVKLSKEHSQLDKLSVFCRPHSAKLESHETHYKIQSRL